MSQKACPHCRLVLPQTRPDGRCVGCGKNLPKELCAPPDQTKPLMPPYDPSEHEHEGQWEWFIKGLAQKCEKQRMSLEEAATTLPEYERWAVALWILTTQVFNGGIQQWIFNGYYRQMDDVMAGLTSIGTESAMGLKAIMTEVAALIETGDLGTADGEETIGTCSWNFYDFTPDFGDDIDRWLTEKQKRGR